MFRAATIRIMPLKKAIDPKKRENEVADFIGKKKKASDESQYHPHSHLLSKMLQSKWLEYRLCTKPPDTLIAGCKCPQRERASLSTCHRRACSGLGWHSFGRRTWHFGLNNNLFSLKTENKKKSITDHEISQVQLFENGLLLLLFCTQGGSQGFSYPIIMQITTQAILPSYRQNLLFQKVGFSILPPFLRKIMKP